GLGGAVTSYYNDKKTDAQIAGLISAVNTANKNQQDNTEKFLTAFSKMSGEIGDLKTEASTENFRHRVDQLQAELVSTQKKLSPPKSALTFSFDKPDI